MVKRATKKAAKKPAAKRELIAPRGDKRYIRRDAAGRIKESDDVSRSLSQDRQEGKESCKLRTGRSRRPEARIEGHGAEKDACQELVTRSTFSKTTRSLKDSPIRPNS
jgi:hypothetical protein